MDTDGHAAAARLAPVIGDDFYLAGGTALALRHGHRVSLDLDLFSATEKLYEPRRISLIGGLKTSGRVTVAESADGTLHLRLAGTPVSLFHYPYPLCRPFSPWSGIPVAADLDIAAMKLSAIVGRGSRKDFLDLYWICRKTGLKAALDVAQVKFRDHPDFLLQAARALVYFEDADREPAPRLLLPISWRKVRSYFESEAPKVLRERLR